jgi:hypothetical protein
MRGATARSRRTENGSALNLEVARVRCLTVDETKRLANACDPVLRNLVLAGLQTGARYGELARLRVNDFNHDNGTVAIRESKSGKPRHVILTEEGRSFFRQLCAGRRAPRLCCKNPVAVNGSSHIKTGPCERLASGQRSIRRSASTGCVTLGPRLQSWLAFRCWLSPKISVTPIRVWSRGTTATWRLAISSTQSVRARPVLVSSPIGNLRFCNDGAADARSPRGGAAMTARQGFIKCEEITITAITCHDDHPSSSL